MNNNDHRDDILDEFSMESVITPSLLKQYIERFPEQALELTDLYHELTMSDLNHQVKGTSYGTDDVREHQGHSVANALSGEHLVDIADRWNLPRDFFIGFRDVQVRLGSVPAVLMKSLATALDVRIDELIEYLGTGRRMNQTMAYKSDLKPSEAACMEYEDFIQALQLNSQEMDALARLSGSDGRD